MNAITFLDEDVPDPTDFPLTAPGLRQLDDALRCSVCRELFFAPVTVNCPSGHCFCSACIRTTTAHTADPVCPLCRESISDTQIRRNQSMEDVVKAWKEARIHSVLVQKQHNYRQFYAKHSKKEAQIGSLVADPDELVHCPVCSVSIRNGSVWIHIDKGCPSPTPSESGQTPEKRTKSVNQKEKWNKVFSGSKVSSSHSSSKGKAKGKARASASTPISEDFSEPLPKVSYDTLSAKRVKEMLQEHGLSTHGDKSAMVARHQRWVIMYNANRDASESQRKTPNQLREELRKREENEERRKKVKRKDLDMTAHQETHKTMFAQLTEAAKRSGRPPKTIGTASEVAGASDVKEPSPSKPPSSQASQPTDVDAVVIDDADT
ncbi:hypothetical protein EIP86_002303 [Pleurotus ostreatoroseus]|nr:hypothetical protein EIP86_002303 [Pleurotus ostreatoroseus]